MRPARTRLSSLDGLVFAAVAGFVAFIAYRVEGVLNYHWHWSRVAAYLVRWDEARGVWTANLLLQGFFTTLRLALWGILWAALIGLVMGIARTSRALLPRLVALVYVGLVRNTPPLVFIFIFYFFISSQLVPWLGLERVAATAVPAISAVIRVLCGDPKLLVNFVTGLICLALFEGAYVTEIVRAGIQSLERGQWEAGRGLGLSQYRLLRLVILPQAFRRILPPLAGQFVSLIKTSSIVSLISIQELTFSAGEVAVTTGAVFEVWLVAAGMYFAICYPCSLVFARLERRLTPRGGS
ncbi:MAG: amino acid ABC transporter permease [Alphaproteobacteria bacterium]|nr:amino acid ABC transporter permease [Alphaproteobacteria bacterium]